MARCVLARGDLRQSNFFNNKENCAKRNFQSKDLSHPNQILAPQRAQRKQM